MPLDIVDRCTPAEPELRARLSAAMRPPERLDVAAWSERHRVISSESGSPFPGRWSHDRAPHLVGIMGALDDADPCEDVVVVASAQTGKSEVGVNFLGYIADADPGPTLIVLPSHEESGKYVRTKIEPTISETPVLRRRVYDMTARSERGSTASFKKFPGGFAQVTFAGSSRGLQMLSARYTIAEELSEWPAEAGERGDPAEQLKKRTETYEAHRKRLWVSTPALAGACRISAMYQASDRRRRYVPCPHCGAYQVLTFDALRWQSDTPPHRAWFACLANGCAIEQHERAEILAQGEWIPTAGEDAPPECFPAGELAHWRAREVPRAAKGFHLWKAYSLFTRWDGIVSEYLAARDTPHALRVFTQQTLGEAWEERGDAPDAERLHAVRLPDMARGTPPQGPVFFTGATDVQGNRLEWAVWGWSEGMTRWLIDWGVIEGDPAGEDTWRRHDEIMNRAWPVAGGGVYKVEAWAIDSGYMSQVVYDYTRRRPLAHAVDGQSTRNQRLLPFIGQARKVDVRRTGRMKKTGAVLWPVGSFAVKSDLYSAIRKTIEAGAGAGPVRGGVALPAEVSIAYCEQLTSEYLARIERRSGYVDQQWTKLSGRPNEGLDVACYARAMAYLVGLDRLDDEGWAAHRAERGRPLAQPGLFEPRADAPAAPAETPEPGNTDRIQTVVEGL